VQLFNQGPAIPFYIIVERLSLQGVTLHRSGSPFLFQRHVNGQLLILCWPVMADETLIERALQLNMANRLALNDDETWAVFSWVRVDGDR
jgi:hypothetical protein